MKETSRGKKINVSFIIKYYVHRYIRITPPYMVMVFISLTLTKYIGSGPFYPPEGFEPSECKYNWWHNLLYINNLYDPFKMVFFSKFNL
jgi:peptidoglycan/LPS O-acetylase OafA/YrhL